METPAAFISPDNPHPLSFYVCVRLDLDSIKIATLFSVFCGGNKFEVCEVRQHTITEQAEERYECWLESSVLCKQFRVVLSPDWFNLWMEEYLQLQVNDKAKEEN